MDNDPVNKSNEEEYQFSDTEHSTEFAPPRASVSAPVNQGSMGNRKTIFIIVGILVAVFCLYKLYDVFSAAPVRPKNEMPAVTTKEAPAVVAPKPAEPTVPDELSSVQNKVGTLEKVVSQVSQSNANLQDQMAGVSTAIADIQNSISSLSQQVSDLAKPKENPTEVKKTEERKSDEVKPKIKVKTKVKAKSASNMKKVAVSNYYIKAMIQGRAWLMSSDGATLTVSEGDNLPGYGVIGSVDPASGEIKTSTGAVIRYQAEDR